MNLVVNGGGELMSSAGVTLAKQWFWCKYPDLEMELRRNRLSDTKPQAERKQNSVFFLIKKKIFFFNQDREAPSHRMCFLIDTYQ